MRSIRTILFPTDFSEYSLTAFHFACSFAAHYRAKLVIVHVKEPPVVVGELVAPFCLKPKRTKRHSSNSLQRCNLPIPVSPWSIAFSMADQPTRS